MQTWEIGRLGTSGLSAVVYIVSFNICRGIRVLIIPILGMRFGGMLRCLWARVPDLIELADPKLE